MWFHEIAPTYASYKAQTATGAHKGIMLMLLVESYATRSGITRSNICSFGVAQNASLLLRVERNLEVLWSRGYASLHGLVYDASMAVIYSGHCLDLCGGLSFYTLLLIRWCGVGW